MGSDSQTTRAGSPIGQPQLGQADLQALIGTPAAAARIGTAPAAELRYSECTSLLFAGAGKWAGAGTQPLQQCR